jgi:hypothetical protein
MTSEEFYQKFPNLFPPVWGDQKAPITIGEGWEGLVERTLEQLSPLKVQVLQIKEKFGGLRIYVGGEDSEVAWTIIREAELEADRTCEKCGTQEGVTIGGRGWIRTLCGECRKGKA